MAQIEISDKVKDILSRIQSRDEHKSMDSVVRVTLIKAGELKP